MHALGLYGSGRIKFIVGLSVSNVSFSFILEKNYDIKSKNEGADRLAERTVGERKGVAERRVISFFLEREREGL